MTHSLSFAQAVESALFRGVQPDLINDMFSGTGLETPFLLLSRSEVRNNVTVLQAALPRAELHYAVKSNNYQTVLNEVAAAGGGFEVCSAAETEAVLRTGARPDSLIHTHPIKSAREFDAAVAAGIEVFVVDNPDEVSKFARYTDRRLKVLIRFRINTNTTAVVNLQYKFGCTVDAVLPLARQIKEAGHEYYGLSFHIGSQCVYTDNYVKAIRAAHELIGALDAAGFTTRVLDIGGGFPVQYVEPIPPIEGFGETISRELDQHISSDIRIVCEPGRFISASPVTLVCSVVGKALRDGKMWYYLDDGLYSTFSGIVFDHCQYPVVTAKHGDSRPSVLSGPTCDSFDVLYDGLMIPNHNVGDVIVFPMTGAYCAVSGSDFNSLRRANYVIID